MDTVNGYYCVITRPVVGLYRGSLRAASHSPLPPGILKQNPVARILSRGRTPRIYVRMKGYLLKARSLLAACYVRKDTHKRGGHGKKQGEANGIANREGGSLAPRGPGRGR